jgi:hypothetical protein
MTKRTKQSACRLFRRFRAIFKADLGIEKLTGADRVLLDQCALLAVRARQMRDDVLGGEKVVDDDDLVRATNAAIRAMKVLAERGTHEKRPKRPYGLADIQAALARDDDDEDEPA